MVKKLKKMSNTTKATAVGVTAGGGGAAVITWLAAEAEKRYGVPAAAGAMILGTVFGFVARWAAKLLPDG
jgi:fucose permease